MQKRDVVCETVKGETVKLSDLSSLVMFTRPNVISNSPTAMRKQLWFATGRALQVKLSARYSRVLSGTSPGSCSQSIVIQKSRSSRHSARLQTAICTPRKWRRCSGSAAAGAKVAGRARALGDPGTSGIGSVATALMNCNAKMRRAASQQCWPGHPPSAS